MCKSTNGINIPSFLFHSLHTVYGSQGVWSLSQESSGNILDRSITEPSETVTMHALTPTVKFKSLINLTCMSFRLWEEDEVSGKNKPHRERSKLRFEPG